MQSLLTWGDFMTGSGIPTAIDRVDMEPVLAKILYQQRTLLGMIPAGPPAMNLPFQHLEDELNAIKIVGAFTAATNTFVPANTYSQADVYRLLRHSATAGARGVVLQTEAGGTTIRRNIDTGLPLAGDTNWDVIAGADSDVAAGTTWIIALPKPDEAAASVDTSKTRTKRQGYTRVFERSVESSKTREGEWLYAVPDEVQLQAQYRTEEMLNELAASIIRDHVYISGGTVQFEDIRTMSGIIQQLRDPDLDGVNEDYLNADASSAALTPALLNARIRALYDEGAFDVPGYDGAIVCSPYQAQVISSFNEDMRRSGIEYRKAGYYVSAFVSNLGKEFPIVIDTWWPTPMVGILDLSRIERRDMNNDTWQMGEIKMNTLRVRKWQLTGQFGVSVKNVDKVHALIYGLATS